MAAAAAASAADVHNGAAIGMNDGDFDHGGGGGSCGGPAVAAVEAVEDNLSAKAAGNESVDGRMTACNDEIGRQKTMQQPANERRLGGGGSDGGGSATARGRRLLCGSAKARRRRQLDGGEAVAAA